VTLTSFKGNPPFATECVSTGIEGQVVLTVWSLSKGSKYSADQASMDAIHLLLFNGIAPTAGCQSQPPLLSDSASLNNFALISKDFFNKRGSWRNYATATMLPPNETSVANNKAINVYRVNVTKDNLRKYLVEKQIIKGLNHGF